MWLQRNGKTCTSGLVMAGNWAKNVWKNEEKERGLQYGKEIGKSGSDRLCCLR